jgi:hypothetical protein
VDLVCDQCKAAGKEAAKRCRHKMDLPRWQSEERHKDVSKMVNEDEFLRETR